MASFQKLHAWGDDVTGLILEVFSTLNDSMLSLFWVTSICCLCTWVSLAMKNSPWAVVLRHFTLWPEQEVHMLTVWKPRRAALMEASGNRVVLIWMLNSIISISIVFGSVSFKAATSGGEMGWDVKLLPELLGAVEGCRLAVQNWLCHGLLCDCLPLYCSPVILSHPEVSALLKIGSSFCDCYSDSST